jgi:hypothetical protein
MSAFETLASLNHSPVCRPMTLPVWILEGNRVHCRSQWPRGLRRRSAVAWLLGSRIRIPLEAWMFVCCVYVLSCVGRGLCDGLITRPEESYRVSVCDQETPKRETKGPSWTISACEWMDRGHYTMRTFTRNVQWGPQLEHTFLGNPQEQRPLGTSSCTQEDNIK